MQAPSLPRLVVHGSGFSDSLQRGHRPWGRRPRLKGFVVDPRRSSTWKYGKYWNLMHGDIGNIASWNPAP